MFFFESFPKNNPNFLKTIPTLTTFAIPAIFCTFVFQKACIYVCVVLSTNKRDKPDCLVVFVTELNWPVLNICTPSSFYTFENKMFGFVLP